MAQFCNQGDTARVTFPDGSIQDFTDTPINIICEDIPRPDCEPFSITYDAYYSDFGVITVYRTTSAGRRLPYEGIRVQPGYPWIIEAKTRGLAFSFCEDETKWQSIAGRPQRTDRIFVDAILVSLNYTNPDPGKIIKVFGSAGDELFSAEFPNCNYSVECLEECPPNTLDCGDCCLQCDSVLSAIKNIRSLVISRL
ncbi:hypothetical protein [Anabaena sp. CCY 0017]|uniref:hypothetical protein n=1 Tax=Anabaena sp. CCY 0017 TaxID=3103866 RepID=UPI0039C7322A